MSHLQITDQGVFTSIALNQPPMNCLTSDFMQEIMATLGDLQRRPAASKPRVIILRSAISGVFSYGMDPQYFLKSNMDGRKRLFQVLAEMLDAFYRLGIPVVADISGPALAGGAVLALIADFTTIGKETGKISFSETKVGLPVPPIVQDLVRYKVNPSACLDVFLIGKNYDADAALRIGMVNHVHSNDQERDQFIKDICSRFERLAPEVVARTLLDAKSHLLAGKAEFLRSMESQFVPFLSDEFLGKGLKALVAGQKATW